MTTMYIVQMIVTLLTGIAGLSGLVVALIERRKKHAEAREIEQRIETDYAARISDTAMALIEPLRRQIESQSAQIAALEERLEKADGKIARIERQLERSMRRISYLMGGIDALLRQINSLQAVPVWTPDAWSLEDGQDGHS